MILLKLGFFLFLISLPFCQSLEEWNITDTFDNGRYMVTRHVDLVTKTIQFEVIAETLGFVGFGVSPGGGMEGADIVIGGVDSTGAVYFDDYYATGEFTPSPDAHKDWTLDAARENGSHTFLTFSRLFDTCDSEDVVINENTLSMIWSVGSTDTLGYHRERRGSFRLNILDPPSPMEDVSQFQKWEIVVSDPLPVNDTTYYCTIHKTPSYIQNHHVVGFDHLVTDPFAITHTHHFVFKKCLSSPETDHLFEAYLGKPAVKCYPDSPTGESHPLSEECSAYLWVWGTGGLRTMIPDHVGFPIGEHLGRNEYFMLEVHYDNPALDENVQFDTGLVVYHTDNLRPTLAGVMIVGHEVFYGHTIPPNSEGFMSIGHCPSECTATALPEDGINIFRVNLHSHLSGRKLKLRQFRHGNELQWAANDANFDFNFQNNRPVANQLIVLPGDHLTYECVTDTTWKNGGITLGGMSSSDEMCEVILMYYPRIEMDLCESTYPENYTLRDLGIESVGPGVTNPIVTAPANMSGRYYADVLTNMIDWTPELRERYANNIVKSDHDFHCGARGKMMVGEFIATGITNYPNGTIYEEENNCKDKENSATVFAIRNIFTLSLLVIIKWFGGMF